MEDERPQPFEIGDEKVIEALEEFEIETLCSVGVKNISGGFAKAEIFNFDVDYFDIELTWGIQSDCENNVTTEQLKMDRMTLLIS